MTGRWRRRWWSRPVVSSLSFLPDALAVQASDFAAFTRELPGVARAAGVSLFEVAPADELLESVFSYLVQR